MDEVDIDIYDAVAELGPVTLSELARSLGWSKSMIHRRVMSMASQGVLDVRREGGAVVISLPKGGPPRVLELGIIRASEYPYVMPLLRALRNRYGPVRVKVYDDALQLVNDLAAGRVQLAFAPAVTLLLFNRITRGRIHIVGGGSSGGAVIVRGSSGEGHATSMMSSMEYCAESNSLEPPRVYLKGGDRILEAVARGQVREGVVWEPYASMAKSMGLSVEPCELNTCCLLGANSSVEQEYERVTSMAAQAIAEAKRVDLQAYAALIGVDEDLVRRSLASYEFLEEPDRGVLYNMLSSMKGVALPTSSIKEAVRA